MAEALTACQSCCGDQKKTIRFPEASTPATCSTLNGPFGVCQLVTGAPGCNRRPEIAETFTACQSCCGDQKKTIRSPAWSTPATCSTLKGPFGVCHRVRIAPCRNLRPDM